MKRTQESRKRKLRDENNDDDDDDVRCRCKVLRLSLGKKSGILDRSTLESSFKREDVNTSPESEDGIQTLPSPGEVPLKQMIQENYVYLKRELDPDEIVDQLSGFLDQRQVERIQECHSRRRKTDLLLKTLVHAEENNLRTKKMFFYSLLKCKYKHICLKLMNKNETQENNSERFSLEWCRCFLSNKKKDINDNIDPLLFIDEILDKGGMNFNDHEDITNMIHREERVSALLKLIRTDFDKAPLFLVPMVQEYKMLDNKKQEQPVEQKRNLTWSCSKVTTHKFMECRSKVFALPNMTVKAKFNIWIENSEKESSTEDVKKKIRQIEFNVVKRGNKKQSTEMFDLLMDSCTSKFEGMSISSVVVHIKVFTTDALQKAISACKNGKAAEWLFKLFTEEDLKVLKDLKVEKVNVTLTMEKDQEVADESLDYDDGTIQNLTMSDIMENWSYLLEELDAKIFVDHLNERGSADFVELRKCLSEEKSRTKRTNMLLRSLRTNQDLKWFEKHTKEKRKFIWKHIIDSKLKRKDTPIYDLTNKITEKYDRICQELEPKRLKGTPIVDKVGHFEAYLDSEVGRKERVVSLLKQIFGQKDESLIQVFIRSLQQAGYGALIKEILQVTSIEDEGEVGDKIVLFAGFYDVSFHAEDAFKLGQKKESKPDNDSCEESGFASGSDALSCNSSKEEHAGSNASNILWIKNWAEKLFMEVKVDKCC